MLLQKEVFTIDELSLYTGYTVDYIYKMVHQGVIPYSKPNGKKLFFVKEEIVSWLSANKHKSDQELEIQANSYLMSKKFGR
ncbi:helix-turn-helix domain-containing protein [Corallibacter sp.]|uniref:helix-turn-helix domain-containing protein n=1 Tax=Corallibacter sp. TaxID=2038084 RepID=UPI003AB72B34